MSHNNQNNKYNVPEHKLIVVGAGAVGKSSLTVQLVSHHFLDFYDPTIEDSYQKRTTVDEQLVVLDILDTAGQDEYSAMRDQYMRTGQGFLLVFDLTQRATFDELAKFAEQISRVKDADVARIPLVVVGNKSDLESARQVTSAEAAAFARSLGAAYVEASARLRSNVDEAFHALVREIRKRAAASRPSAAVAASSTPSRARAAANNNKKLSLGQRLARLFGRRRARV